MGKRLLASSLVAAATATLAGCADEAVVRPDGEVVGGNAGVDEVVDADLTVQDVELPFIAGGYAVGDDAPLYLAVTNRGDANAQLVDVRTDAAASVGGDLPITAPANDNVYIGAAGEPDIVLEGLQTSLRSSQSVPVTFVFADGDEVTVQAVVAAQPQTPGAEDFPQPDEDTSSDG